MVLFLLDMPTPGQWRLLSCEANPGCGRYDSARLCSIDCPSGVLGSVSACLMVSVALHPWNINACLQHCLQECCGDMIGLGFPALAGIVGTGESTASFDCAIPFLG